MVKLLMACFTSVSHLIQQAEPLDRMKNVPSESRCFYIRRLVTESVPLHAMIPSLQTCVTRNQWVERFRRIWLHDLGIELTVASGEMVKAFANFFHAICYISSGKIIFISQTI